LEVGFTEGGEANSGRAALRGTLEGDTNSSSLSFACCDDFRGGGLGGRRGDFLFFSFPTTSRTVELEDEEVDSSLTKDRP
jgi:hypothetical protein